MTSELLRSHLKHFEVRVLQQKKLKFLKPAKKKSTSLAFSLSHLPFTAITIEACYYKFFLCRHYFLSFLFLFFCIFVYRWRCRGFILI